MQLAPAGTRYFKVRSSSPTLAGTKSPPQLANQRVGGCGGDERDEYVVHDLPQDVIGDGPERHQHLVAEQIERQVDDPRGEPGRVDLAALDRAVDDLLDGRA